MVSVQADCTGKGTGQGQAHAAVGQHVPEFPGSQPQGAGALSQPQGAGAPTSIRHWLGIHLALVATVLPVVLSVRLLRERPLTDSAGPRLTQILPDISTINVGRIFDDKIAISAMYQFDCAEGHRNGDQPYMFKMANCKCMDK